MPKPKFNFGSTNVAPLQPVEDGKENRPSFTFKFETQSLEESKAVTKQPFGADFKTEAKMFANKNLFTNQMVTATAKSVTKTSKVKILREEQETSSKRQRPVVLNTRRSLAKAPENTDE